MIVIVLGLPGSRKSYFAERLAEQLYAEYLNSDRLRRELFPRRTYSDQKKVYSIMLEEMEEALRQKRNLVLDATFHRKETRKPFLTKGKGKISVIELRADKEIIRQRVHKSGPFSEADLEVHKLI